MSLEVEQLNAIPPLTGERATSYQVKTTGSIASGGLTIANRNGHRRTLIDVFFSAETAGVFLDITIGDRTFIRLPTTLGDFTALQQNQKGVGFVRNGTLKKTGYGLLRWLRKYVPFDFPTAAQDESIVITPVGSATTGLSYGTIPATYVITAIYLDQDSGDVVSKVVAGGTANPKRLYMNMVTNSLAQPTAGQNLLDKTITPSGLNGIKDQDAQIAGLKLTGYLILYDASALGTTTGANANGKPSRLHIQDVDIELFTVEDQAGLLVDRDLENMLSADSQLETAFILDNPYVFDQNRKFRFLLDTVQKAGTGTNYVANSQFMAIVGIREPVGGA